MKRKADFVHGPIAKILRIFFFPIMFGSLSQLLYNDDCGQAPASAGTLISLSGNMVMAFSAVSCGY